MDIFGRKELKDLKRKVIELEKKGYFGDNENNEYFKQLNSLMSNSIRLLDFSSVNRSQLVKMYWTNAQVRGVVNLIASSVAELSDYAELLDSKDKVDTKHYSNSLFTRPNDRENRRRFIKSWAIYRLLSGDSFVYFEQGIGLKRGAFSSMYVMPSHKVEIQLGGLIAPIAGYKLEEKAGFSLELNPGNVMMSYEPNPKGDTFYGLSPLESAANYIQLLESGLKRQNSSIANGGVANIITPKPDNLGTVTQMVADTIESDLNDVSNINKSKLVRAALEVHRLGDKPTDLGLLDTSKDAITALCFVYNIPIDLYYGQSKYENAKEAKKAVYEKAAIPLFKEFLDDFSQFLKLDKEGLKWSINVDKIEVLNDNIEMLGAYEKMNATLNEKRQLMGFPIINEKWADQPMVPMGISFGPAMFDIDETSE